MLCLVQIVDKVVVDLEVSLDETRGREGQPLRQADILELVYEISRLSISYRL